MHLFDSARPVPHYLSDIAESGLTAAWGFRRLVRNYPGRCGSIRRSSDNTSQDMVFSGDYVHQSDLLSFVGAGNGFIGALDDQVGSADLLQTTQADQPQLVSSGAIITTLGGRPSMSFDGSGDVLLYGGQFDSFITTSAGTIICVFRAVSIHIASTTIYENDPVWSQRASTCALVLKSTPTAHGFNHDGSFDDAGAVSIAVNTNYIHTWKHEGGVVYSYVNTNTPVSVASGNTSSLLAGLALGFVTGNSLNSFNGFITELAMWNRALSATEIAQVQHYMASYYGIAVA